MAIWASSAASIYPHRIHVHRYIKQVRSICMLPFLEIEGNEGGDKGSPNRYFEVPSHYTVRMIGLKPRLGYIDSLSVEFLTSWNQLKKNIFFYR
jgi:hypothetical protein